MNVAVSSQFVTQCRVNRSLELGQNLGLSAIQTQNLLWLTQINFLGLGASSTGHLQMSNVNRRRMLEKAARPV